MLKSHTEQQTFVLSKQLLNSHMSYSLVQARSDSADFALLICRSSC